MADGEGEEAVAYHVPSNVGTMAYHAAAADDGGAPDEGARLDHSAVPYKDGTCDEGEVG